MCLGFLKWNFSIRLSLLVRRIQPTGDRKLMRYESAYSFRNGYSPVTRDFKVVEFRRVRVGVTYLRFAVCIMYFTNEGRSSN